MLFSSLASLGTAKYSTLSLKTQKMKRPATFYLNQPSKLTKAETMAASPPAVSFPEKYLLLHRALVDDYSMLVAHP